MAEQEQARNQELEAEAPEKLQLKIKIEHAESYIYSNVAGVSISPMDIRVDFADVTMDGKAKTVAGITMSPEHAAGFVLLMLSQLHNFENQFGDIRTAKWKEMKMSALQDALAAVHGSTEPMASIGSAIKDEADKTHLSQP